MIIYIYSILDADNWNELKKGVGCGRGMFRMSITVATLIIIVNKYSLNLYRKYFWTGIQHRTLATTIYLIVTWYISMRSVVNCDLSLQWRHNGRDGDSNHQRIDCLLKRLFRRISRKTSKLRVTGLCEGNSPVTGEFPSQRASNAENVSIWWRHHVLTWFV